MNRLILLLCLALFLVFVACDDDSSVDPEDNAPESPTELEVSNYGDGSLLLSWTDNSDNEDYFYVERNISGTESYMEIAQLGADVDTFIDENLVPGVEYAYRVRAGNVNGFSIYSNIASAEATGFVDQPYVWINGNEFITSSRNVNLLIAASECDQMIISNSNDFTDAEWEEFSAQKDWQLETGPTTKTVYVRLITTDGDTSETFYDSIEPAFPDVYVLVNDGAESTSSRHVQIEIAGIEDGYEMIVSNTEIDPGYAIESNEGIEGPKPSRPDESKLVLDYAHTRPSPFEKNELDEQDEWIPFEDEFDWELETGDGTKTVYVRARNDFLIESDNFAIIEPGTPTVNVIINDGEPYVPSRFVTLHLEVTGDPTEMEIENLGYTGGTSNPDNNRIRAGKVGKSRTQLTESIAVNNEKGEQELDEFDEWIPFTDEIDWELTINGGAKQVRVTVRNDFLIEAEDLTTVEALIPENPHIEILGGETSPSYIVDLMLSCENADSMKISNIDDFSNSPWLPYTGVVNDWDLQHIIGEYTDENGKYGNIFNELDEGIEDVFAIFKNSFEHSNTVSDEVLVRETPQSILIESYNNEIAVQETGGIDSTDVLATLLNSFGQPVPDQQKVFFLMDVYPEPAEPDGRPRINDSNGLEGPGNPYYNYELPFDSVMTDEGEASVIIHSGTSTGQMRLVVWTYLDLELRGTENADSLLVHYTGLSVVNGPPASIDVDVSPYAEDGGGATWVIDVTARIADTRNNPVRDSIQVLFEIEEDFATIDPVAYTDSLGIATSSLVYFSTSVNDSVNITATVLTIEGEPISGHFVDFNLPMVDGAAELYADPENWDFTWGDPALFHMTVFVYDGHYHCVNDQLVRFTTAVGQYYKQAIGGAPLNEAITGPAELGAPEDNDDCGWANRYLRMTLDEVFPDPLVLETTVDVGVEIVGHPDIEVAPVTLHVQQ